MIADSNIEEELRTQVSAVAAAGGAIGIVGGGSKHFYGESAEALQIEVAGHCGVIDYDPAELVITLRAGCPLAAVEQLLAEQRQMFGFDAPRFGDTATIGGTIACGIAGPRRAFAGGIRDFVLGVKLLDGRGDSLRFGGRVIKNVAGFDLSRVMVGALGTLGIVLEASIKVVPLPENEQTLAFEHPDIDQHIRWINELGGRPYPLSASCWSDGISRIRLSGSEQGVSHAAGLLGGDRIDEDWIAVREHRHAFFGREGPLTRINLPPTTPDLFPNRNQLVEWGGAQRWLRGDGGLAGLRARLAGSGGNVCAFRGHPPGAPVFHPPSPALLTLHRRLKSSFDPAGIFNPGRLYPGL